VADIEIVGLDALIRKVGNVANAQNVIEPRMRHWSERIGEEWHKYPPPLPGQRYRRTGNLGRGRRQLLQRSARDITAIARSSGPAYNVWVLDGGTQAGIHRGRWRTDDQMVSQYTRNVVDDLDATIQRELDK
jgi:hypothetical protein